jgi:hypothetical protein
MADAGFYQCYSLSLGSEMSCSYTILVDIGDTKESLQNVRQKWSLLTLGVVLKCFQRGLHGLYALRFLTIASLNLVLLMKGYAHWGRESSMSIYLLVYYACQS